MLGAFTALPPVAGNGAVPVRPDAERQLLQQQLQPGLLILQWCAIQGGLQCPLRLLTRELAASAAEP